MSSACTGRLDHLCSEYILFMLAGAQLVSSTVICTSISKIILLWNLSLHIVESKLRVPVVGGRGGGGVGN